MKPLRSAAPRGARPAAALCLALLVSSAPALAGPPGPREQAAWDFEAGKRHLANGKVDKAVEELGSAWGVIKTTPVALAYAQALEKKGDLEAAKKVVAEGLALPKVKNEAFKVTQARVELEKLGAKLGAAATPEAPKPDAAKPDAAKPDAAKPDAAKPDAAKPDAAKPDAAKPDAAKPDAAKPDAAKPAQPQRPAGEPGEAGGGATVAALVGWSAFAFGASTGLAAFFSSKKTLDQLDPSCPNGSCPVHFQDKYGDAQTLRVVSFVGFGLGGAGLVTGIVGAAVAGSQKAASSGAQPAPVRFAVGPTGVAVSGTF